MVERWFYSEKVRDHFFNPRNIFKTDEEAKAYDMEADGVGEVGSPACGDVMKLWIKIDGDKIKECKFQTFGCASAIASTSIMSVMATGMKIDDALKITAKDIADKLGGLPPRKLHCSVLGDQALKSAINNYFEKNDNN